MSLPSVIALENLVAQIRHLAHCKFENRATILMHVVIF